MGSSPTMSIYFITFYMTSYYDVVVEKCFHTAIYTAPQAAGVARLVAITEMLCYVGFDSRLQTENSNNGRLAQLDRASVYGTEGRRFESCIGRKRVYDFISRVIYSFFMSLFAIFIFLHFTRHLNARKLIINIQMFLRSKMNMRRHLP